MQDLFHEEARQEERDGQIERPRRHIADARRDVQPIQSHPGGGSEDLRDDQEEHGSRRAPQHLFYTHRSSLLSKATPYPTIGPGARQRTFRNLQTFLKIFLAFFPAL